jgi:hypothetical protein
VADAKISALPSATSPLAGTEVLPIVQSGTTDKVTAADLLRQSGQTVTTSNPVLSLAQTWNDGAVTFTGWLLNVTDTASASASLLMNLQTGGVSQFNVTRAGTGTFVGSVNAVNYFASGGLIISGDTVLVRDAANTLAQRNGTNAQIFNIYNTYTDSSNFERFAIKAQSGNDVRLQTEKAGTGTARSLVFGTDASVRWLIGATSGHFLAGADNTYDIGASGATRPRNLYVGTKLSVSNAALGSNALDVFTATAGTIAAFQSGAAANGNNLMAVYGGTATGTVTALFMQGDISTSWVNQLYNSGAGSAKYSSLVNGAGDPYISFEVNGVTTWSAGLDNSDADAFVVSQNSALGSNNGLRIATDGVATLYNNLLFGTDNTYDIGASGATRPRDIYAANSLNSGNTVVAGGAIVAGAYVVAGSSWYLGWSGRSSMYSPSDGVITISNNAVSDFSRLQFGGTTSSFPSLKRSGTEIQARLADDSGDATLTAGTLKSGGSALIGVGTAIPAGGNNGIGFKGTSATNFGVFFGSGAPTLSAAKGSLYLRSDGSGTTDRFYINTDGGTTWTAGTTAA